MKKNLLQPLRVPGTLTGGGSHFDDMPNDLMREAANRLFRICMV